MATTSLELSDELKERAASAAHELGVSPHAFMVDAIRQAADAVEQRLQFVAEAQGAHVDMLRSGMGHDAADVRTYLRERLANRRAGSEVNTERPAAKPWRA